jgi:hypothetical protein
MQHLSILMSVSVACRLLNFDFNFAVRFDSQVRSGWTVVSEGSCMAYASSTCPMRHMKLGSLLEV